MAWQRQFERVQITFDFRFKYALNDTTERANFDEPRNVRQSVNEFVDENVGSASECFASVHCVHVEVLSKLALLSKGPFQQNCRNAK
jgi:hypothetical protein